jgi:D-amino-acid dehydrogenase
MVMKVVILGAGVAGITSAYVLAKNGCEVTLIDQHAQPGMGASYANGGQLSYHYRTPIANPKVLKQLPKILLGLDPAFKIYPSLDLNFYCWGLRFLWQCLPKKSQHSAAVMRNLGLLAQQRLAEIIDATNIEFDYRRQAGKLYVYQDKESLRSAADNEKLNKEPAAIWSKNKLLQKIPALQNNESVVGGVYDCNEDAADCRQFCQQLTRYIQEHYGVRLLSGHKIEAIEQEGGCDKGGKVKAIKTDKGRIHADHYVLAAGAQSADLVKPLGIRLPIYPMKGYSVTVPATATCVDASVTDTKSKTVYCRLGDRLRIAGFAEFSGTDAVVKQRRIQRLLNNAREFLPGAGDYDHVLESWCGLRPTTPDSIPIVSRTPLDNLFLNTGHGMLGWTHSAATADLLGNMLLGRPQPMDIDCLSLSRF